MSVLARVMMAAAVFAAAVLGAAAPAAGQLHATDIVLMQQSGRLETRGVQPDGSLTPRRLFVGTLSSLGATSDPGFDSSPAALPEGTGLPANTPIGFDFPRAVRVWNGNDFETISPLAVRSRLGPLIAFAPATDPAAGTTSPGLAVSTTSTGVYHNHFTWATFNAERTTQVASPGLYLVTLRVVQPDGLIAPSEPVYLLLNRSRSASLDAAVAWIEANLLGTAPPCPEDYNRDGFRNLDDLGDFITDFYADPPVPGGEQPAASQYGDRVVGFGVACPAAPDAALPYAADAYRANGYRVGFSADGGNACPLDPGQSFPNLDNLGDYITAFYAAGC